MRHLIVIPLVLAAGTDLTSWFGGGRNLSLVGVVFTGEAITGHAANYVDINVFAADGSTLIWNRDTQTSGDGSIVAGEAYGYSPDATLTNPVDPEAGLTTETRIDKDDAWKVSVVNSGTGAAVSGTLTLIVEDGRDYS